MTRPQHRQKNLDEALELVGSLGSLQAGLLLVNIVSNFVYVWAEQAIIFIGATPGYYCDHPGIDDRRGFDGNGTLRGLECKSGDSGCEDGRWVYDNQTYGKTIVTQWDLVCARNGLVESAQGMLMLGGAFGSIFAGFFANYVGRRPVIIASLLIAVTCGLSLIFSPGITAFTVLFAIYGAAQPGYCSTSHVLLLEYLTPKDRGRLGALPPFFYSIGTIVLGALAYFLRDWRHLQAVLVSPYLLLLIAVLFLPESARWYLSRDKITECKQTLGKIAVMHKKDKNVIKEFFSDTTTDDESQMLFTISPGADSPKEQYDSKDDSKDDSMEATSLQMDHRKDKIASKEDVSVPKQRKSGRGVLELFKPPILRITVAVCGIRIIYTMVHIGVVLNTNKLATGNPYLKVIIGGLLEIPGRSLPILLIKRLGSRLIAMYSFFLTGVALVFVVVFHEDTSYGDDLGSIAVAVSLLCRLLITVCITPCLLMTMELFPTTARTLGTGLGQFSARFGGFLATVLLYLDNVFYGFSMTTMSVCCVVASLLCYSLPDTTNEPQLETSADLTTLMKKKRTLLPSRSPVVTNAETKDVM